MAPKDSAAKSCPITFNIEGADGCSIETTTSHGDSLQCRMYHNDDQAEVYDYTKELQRQIISCIPFGLKFQLGQTDATSQVLLIYHSDHVVGRLLTFYAPLKEAAIWWVFLEIFGHS